MTHHLLYVITIRVDALFTRTTPETFADLWCITESYLINMLAPKKKVEK